MRVGAVSKRRADVVDLSRLRIGRLPPVTRFVLEVRDAGSGPDGAIFEWRWTTEDNPAAEGQWRPTSPQIGNRLRRIADRLDPRPVPVRRTRHRVRSRR